MPILSSLIRGGRQSGASSQEQPSSKMPFQSLTRSLATAPGHSWVSPPEHALDNSSESILRAFASLPIDLVLDHLQVSCTGLTDDEAQSRLAVKGPNTLRSEKPPSWFILLLKVIPNAFNFLLIFLAIITAAMPDHDWVSCFGLDTGVSFGPD